MLHDCVGGGLRDEKSPPPPGGGSGASYVLLPVHAQKVNQRWWFKISLLF